MARSQKARNYSIDNVAPQRNGNKSNSAGTDYSARTQQLPRKSKRLARVSPSNSNKGEGQPERVHLVHERLTITPGVEPPHSPASFYGNELLEELRNLKANQFTWVKDVREKLVSSWHLYHSQYQEWRQKAFATISSLRARGLPEEANKLAEELLTDPLVRDPGNFEIMYWTGYGQQVFKFIGIDESNEKKSASSYHNSTRTQDFPTDCRSGYNSRDLNDNFKIGSGTTSSTNHDTDFADDTGNVCQLPPRTSKSKEKVAPKAHSSVSSLTQRNTLSSRKGTSQTRQSKRLPPKSKRLTTQNQRPSSKWLRQTSEKKVV